MFKFPFILTIVILSSTSIVGSPTTYGRYYPIDDIYHVSGGRTTITFDDESDLEQFNLYTEFDKKPWILDEKLYFYNLCEQKAIYKKTFTDVDVSIDINTINSPGKFDTGIYVGKGFSNPIDGCNAYEVNLEKGADKTQFYLKLHKFNYGYQGAKVEISGLKLSSVNLNLRVVVKDGYIYAFVDHRTTPEFSYNIGIGSNMVGLRNFYSPNYVDNFTVIGDGIDINKSNLELLIGEAESIDESKYTSKTYNQLANVLLLAKEAISDNNQYDIDKYEEQLERALNNLIVKRSVQELDAAISRAREINNDEGIYTKNSYKALEMVLSIAESVNREDEEVVSYWCNQLEAKMRLLIEYIR